LRAGAHEVWARAAWVPIDLARRAGMDVASFFEGLPFDEPALRRMKRVPWDQYCTLVERLEDAAGGPEGFDGLLSREIANAYPEVQALTAAFISPKAIIRFVIEIGNPILFPPVEFRFVDLGDDCARINMWLRPGARPCRAFFHASGGSYRGMTRHLGLPPARAESTTTPYSSASVLYLPPSATVATRAKRASERVLRRGARIILGYDDDGEPVSTAFGDSSALTAEERLAAASGAWDLTPRQSEVLAILARGRSNKEIAAALGCAENTVELHVTQLFRRAGTGSRGELIARFWSGD
jgi:DNA-binding CsgD family transcriptional regulator